MNSRFSRAILFSTLRGALLVSSVLGISGCEAMLDDEQGEASSEVVAGTSRIADHVTVYEDRLEFDATGAKILQAQGLIDKMDQFAAAEDPTEVEPVIFVGNRSSKAVDADGMVDEDSPNPMGYLRRFVSYAKVGSKLVVRTKPANIEEAAAEIGRRGFSDLHTNSLRPLSGANVGAGGVSSTVTGSDDGIDADFSFDAINKSETLFEWKDDQGDSVNVKATAKLTVKPHVKASFVSGKSVMKAGALFISGKIEGSAQFEVTVSGSAKLEKKGKILKKPWRRPTMIGGLPATVSLELDWRCGVEANGKASLTVGALATGSIGPTGADWRGDDVKTSIGTPDYSFTPIGPTLKGSVSTNLNCHILPIVTVSLFDVVGPLANLDLWTKLDLQQAQGLDIQAGVYAGGSLTLGGGLKPFGYNLASWMMKPITFGPNGPIVSKTFSVASLGGEVAP